MDVWHGFGRPCGPKPVCALTDRSPGADAFGGTATLAAHIANVHELIPAPRRSGLDLSDFIDRVRAGGIKTIGDVRELPLSRKRGFSKVAFEAAMADAPILGLFVVAAQPVGNRPDEGRKAC